MTQTLYAHMNKIKIFLKRENKRDVSTIESKKYEDKPTIDCG
jgi:hypothetical protein